MITIKKIKPLFNKILVSCELYSEDDFNNDIIDSSKENGSIKEFQKVLAVGPLVRDVKVGDLVVINPTRYKVMKHKEGSLKDGVITDNAVISYNFPIIDIDGVPHMYIYDSDVDFVIDEFEEVV